MTGGKRGQPPNDQCIKSGTENRYSVDRDPKGVSMKVLTVLGLVAVVGLPLAIVAQAPQRGPAAQACAPGDSQFVCEQTAPEDLVLVPGGDWVVASMYGGAG